MHISGITYNLDGAMLVVSRDRPGFVCVEFTDLAGTKMSAGYVVWDSKQAQAAARDILTWRYGADIAPHRMLMLAVSLENLVRE